MRPSLAGQPQPRDLWQPKADGRRWAWHNQVPATWQPVMSQLHTRESGGWKGANGGAKVPSLSRSLAVANLRHVAVAVADADCFCGHEGRHDGHVIKSS